MEAAKIQKMIEELIMTEGGFVHDKDDPGGATKYGITRATLAAYRDKPTSISDVRNLTRQEAVKIYEQRYLNDTHAIMLPDILIPSVFDAVVNMGGRGVVLLQSTLNGFGESLATDGAIGAQTLAAAQRMATRAGRYLVDAYGIERREYYYRLADRRPASRKYARRRDGGKGGWIIRAEGFVSMRFRLDDAAHKARTQHWK